MAKGPEPRGFQLWSGAVAIDPLGARERQRRRRGFGADVTSYRLVALYAAVLAGFVTWLYVARRRAGPSAPVPPLLWALALGGSYLFLPRHLPLIQQGMESILAFPLLLLFFFCLAQRRLGVAGIVGALLVASRLDTFVLALLPLAALWALAMRQPQETLRSIVGTFLRIAGPATLFVAVYMGANQIQFGHALPIHGALKSSVTQCHWQPASVLGFSGSWGGSRIGQPLRALLAGGLALPLLLPTGRLARPLRWLGLSLLLLTGIQLANLLLFQKWSKPMTSWYGWLPLAT